MRRQWCERCRRGCQTALGCVRAAPWGDRAAKVAARTLKQALIDKAMQRAWRLRPPMPQRQQRGGKSDSNRQRRTADYYRDSQPFGRLLSRFTTLCRENDRDGLGKLNGSRGPIVAPEPFLLIFSCRVSLGPNKRRTATSCSVLESAVLRRRSIFSAYRREMDPQGQARAWSVLPSARRQHFRSPNWLPWLHTLFERERFLAKNCCLVLVCGRHLIEQARS